MNTTLSDRQLFDEPRNIPSKVFILGRFIMQKVEEVEPAYYCNYHYAKSEDLGTNRRMKIIPTTGKNEIKTTITTRDNELGTKN